MRRWKVALAKFCIHSGSESVFAAVMIGPAFTIAHISDLHLAPPSRPSLGSLLNKRLLGFVSWHRRKHVVKQENVLSALVRDLKQIGPHHITVTGDVTTLSLPIEFESAATWLHGLGDADAVSVVPGNHDAYVRVPWEKSWMHWRAFMTSDTSNGMREPIGFGDFPWVRRRGFVALVGVSTATPSWPFMATGRIDRLQLERLQQVLEQLERQGLFRVVILHHSPVAKATHHRKRLVGGAALRKVLASAGADLILHGHEHRFLHGEIPGPRGSIPVIGVPSASGLARRSENGIGEAGYNLIEIKPGTSNWHLRISSRRFDLAHFVLAGKRRLILPHPSPR